MTQDAYDPKDFEEILIKTIYKNSNKGKEAVQINSVITDLKENVDKDISEEMTIRSINRFIQEGFVAQVFPGTIKMLPCGEIKLEDNYEQ